MVSFRVTGKPSVEKLRLATRDLTSGLPTTHSQPRPLTARPRRASRGDSSLDSDLRREPRIVRVTPIHYLAGSTAP
jgi:hypothetical protein